MEKKPIAYQLYSAREEAAKDLDKVLGQLKEMGYDGVEFAGFYGHNAQDVKSLLDKYGLKAISSHVALSLIREDMFGVLSFHRTIGCKFIAIPYSDEQTRPGAAGFASLIQTIYQFGRLCKKAGIQLLYHNHDFEFVKVSGEYGLDFLYDAVPPCLLQTELDVCWVKFAGEDPVKYLDKYSGRAPVVHLKDFVGSRLAGHSPYALIGLDEDQDHSDTPFEFRPFGYGCQDVKAVVEAGIKAGAEWFVIEQDRSDMPLADAQKSIDTLRKLGL